MYATHGSPSSALAAMARRIGASASHASRGSARHDRRARAARLPRRRTRRCRRSEIRPAPSSSERRSVSTKSELPPSIRMSPASRCGLQMRDDAVDRLARPAPSSGCAAAARAPPSAPAGCRRRRSPCALRRPSTNACVFVGVEVVAGDRKSLALDVAREVRAHHAEPDHSHRVLSSVRPIPPRRASGRLVPTREQTSRRRAAPMQRCRARRVSVDHSPRSTLGRIRDSRG